jgi:DNA polymerase-3 subunit delta
VLAAVANSSRFDVFQLGAAALSGDAPRALRILAGLRGEGVEPSLVLWSLLRDLRALWAARHPAAAASRPRWGAQGAALQKALGRAAEFPFARLAARAACADRVIKGRLPGDPWDELALLTAEFCGRRVLPPLARRRA